MQSPTCSDELVLFYLLQLLVVTFVYDSTNSYLSPLPESPGGDIPLISAMNPDIIICISRQTSSVPHLLLLYEGDRLMSQLSVSEHRI